MILCHGLSQPLLRRMEGWWGKEGKRKCITFSLSGIPDNAFGSLEARTFWIMVELAATPQTVPMERKR